MHLVIPDSSTLLHLAEITRFYLIRSYYPPLIIPRAVLKEIIESGKNMHGSQEITTGIERGDIMVHEIINTRLSLSLQNEIHPGEAEVIVLALELDRSILLLDDHDARIVASRLSLKYTGVLGILIRAKLDGKISSLRTEIEGLRNHGKFWISDQVLHKALKYVGEE